MIDLKKYDLPVPRYTSFPTVPFWDNKTFKLQEFESSLQTTFWESSKEISLYIHLPFCESLCTYCACNTRITKNHQVESIYINYLLKEWNLYLERFPSKPIINEIHLGGGTPTFFSPANLEYLIDSIFLKSEKSEGLSMSFEGHPSNTTASHLKVLYNLGFDRLSLGIQDFDEKVQVLINRKQTISQVKEVTNLARSIGYSSINYDMVYGLPGQTKKSLNDTLDKVNSLSPNRIAFYSYAHVPSIKPAQKSYEKFLPSANDKYSFKIIGKERMIKFGYQEVGMDHFVLPGDELLVAQKTNKLHRNFMGYTAQKSKLLIGLGASSISDAWTAFAQNEKNIEAYGRKIDDGNLPIIKGHMLTRNDLFIRKHILNLMCRLETFWEEEEVLKYGVDFDFNLLESLMEDELVFFDSHGLKVLDAGKEVIRVVCSALDKNLSSKSVCTFSKSI